MIDRDDQIQAHHGVKGVCVSVLVREVQGHTRRALALDGAHLGCTRIRNTPSPRLL